MFVRLLLTAVLATTLVSAQGKKGGGMGGGTGMGPSPGAQRPSKLEQFTEKLKLTNEQKQDVLGMLRAALEQAAPLRDPMEKDRVAIAGAMIEGKSSDDLKKLLDDYTSLAAQMTDIEAKTFGKVYESLKPNQQPKAAQAFELLVAVLEPAGGGRSGGRGRGKQ